MKQQVWFVTGCSTGIGRVLAEEVLKAGHKLVATARKPEQLDDLKPLAQPGQLLIQRLDVRDDVQIATAVEAAKNTFGRIDVLMNNAGYGLEGTVEETSMALVRDQMETNFFGLVAMTKAVLPLMRAQQYGYIFNVASVAGLRGMAGLPIYSASKFAVVGFSESLTQEVKHLGIRVSVVEPGPYRTDWAGRSIVRGEGVHAADSAYLDVNKRTDTYLNSVTGKQPGDPRQIARVLLSASQHDKPPVHLLFGDEAIKAWQTELERVADPNFMRYLPHGTESL